MGYFSLPSSYFRDGKWLDLVSKNAQFLKVFLKIKGVIFFHKIFTPNPILAVMFADLDNFVAVFFVKNYFDVV